jgi:hypothetical protein
MVHLDTHQEMEKKYRNNLEQYIREHPGEFVLFEKDGKIEETFYKTEKELDKAIEKYKGLFGPTFFSAQIPCGFITYKKVKNPDLS